MTYQEAANSILILVGKEVSLENNSRAYYLSSIQEFCIEAPSSILGKITAASEFDPTREQIDAWTEQVGLLKSSLEGIEGTIAFEYTIPRMGKRVDVILLVDKVVFVVEFKVHSKTFDAAAIDQVVDYSLDLKNFHEQSHRRKILPILIATDASPVIYNLHWGPDAIGQPVLIAANQLGDLVTEANKHCDGMKIEPDLWIGSAYRPTPTIIEAARALYSGHSVEEISRSGAGATNLTVTSRQVEKIIHDSRQSQHKSICFVTGVPGAGKTLAGLTISTKDHQNDTEASAVFLSGNGPLVEVLREALVRDKVEQNKQKGIKQTKKSASQAVNSVIQNVHHFRDSGLSDKRAPHERVVVFDEAQRAWSLHQTCKFMREKKGRPDFHQSEPEFLISMMDRHDDWAVIVCLVGEGQEINTGEAGIQEWLNAVQNSFPHWQVFASNHAAAMLQGSRDTAVGTGALAEPAVHTRPELHLATCLRSFRAEKLSDFIAALLDLDLEKSAELLGQISEYPLVVTRDIEVGKNWVRKQARGTERYGLIASSGALRLKPLAANVKVSLSPKHWFLDGKSDVRSSYYLEDVATEFHIQGLEIDWACVAWDGDLRYSDAGWVHRSFRGTRWTKINKEAAQVYLVNAYRVLLTRARQGMVIVVPVGSDIDETRSASFYDPIYKYLREVGIPLLQ